MHQEHTQAIILTRVEYGEADRIITFLTPERGKLVLLAKGVRKIKSKLAGGIELFSISDVSYVKGRGEVGTLTSARLVQHFGDIVKDLDRLTYAYKVLKMVHKSTEDQADSSYFDLLKSAFEQLNKDVPLALIEPWFSLQLMQVQGHAPNLRGDVHGKPLKADGQYQFDHQSMSFSAQPEGPFQEAHIKLLRLMLVNPPEMLRQVKHIDQYLPAITQLTTTLLSQNYAI